MNLSAHFTLEEMTISQTAVRNHIDNSASPYIIKNLIHLASSLEQVRNITGSPIIITSGYRCPELNSLIGGDSNSAHMLGLAADIICPKYTVFELGKMIVDAEIVFDQLIYEYGHWVHFGLSIGKPRQELWTYIERKQRPKKDWLK